MTKKMILSAIREILNNDLEIVFSENQLDSTLLELGIDSILFMTLLVYLENKLSIEIDLSENLNHDYSKITINLLLELICNKLDVEDAL